MATPTDPFWNFGNSYSFLPGIEVIWDEYSGAGIKVGVYDDGVESTHEDLNDNYDANLSIVDGSGNPVDPSHTVSGERHGTPVSGIISGEWNGLGGVGVAWGSTFGAVNIFSGYASGAGGYNDFVDALAQASGIFDVTNHSYGYYASFNQGLAVTGFQVSRDLSGIETMVDQGRGGLGTIYVGSAGNDNLEANGTGINASHFTITVAAATNSASGVNGITAADFSNFGTSILVTAAGTSVVASDRVGGEGYVGGDYTYFGGTSAAAPVVSGVVTL
ncbi:MAG: S8 family serine peptidase, partial [Pseudomonadota bacterium]